MGAARKKREGTLVIPKKEEGKKGFNRFKVFEMEGTWYNGVEKVDYPVYKSWADFDPTEDENKEGYIVLT